MKLTFMGNLESLDDLPTTQLPEQAVKFKEPNNLIVLYIIATLYSIPLLLIIIGSVLLKIHIYGEDQFYFSINLIAIIVSLLLIVPHELLHAIVYPEDAEVEIWFVPKMLGAVCTSTYPISKARFIFLGALPNIVFGIIPLLLWTFIPISDPKLSIFIFTFILITLPSGAGDLMNIVNAIFQVPRRATIQLSGLNSYWYLPNESIDTVQ